MKPFQYIADLPNVHFIRNRHYIVWGGYSITNAYISGMKEVLEHGHYEYIVLMSGQDYPIRPVEEFYDHLSEHRGYSYMSVETKIPKSKWWFFAQDRYRYYHLNDFRFP